jgi:uncharacterized membrane protein
MSDARSRHHQPHPVVAAERARRASTGQLRAADAITAFAGSMPFVYIHAAMFCVWMLLVEHNPWPKLTLVVSLEAIFLSTFVMIGQNRQAAFQQAKADHDFTESELELKHNTELTQTIHAIAVELHQKLLTEGRHEWNLPMSDVATGTTKPEGATAPVAAHRD